ncbi:MAG: Chromosome (plasmid) partitioning protein ParB / Stage 0 sporulation protein [Alphaproteobacteria bacterium]|nr:Chromosome (plasmid) partitioning protein ParB / Stage 0 sporulation protein [Alphaproteobacteria bacterium]
MSNEKRNPLGRGLNALFGEDDSTPLSVVNGNNTMAAPSASEYTTIPLSRGITRVPLSVLSPGPFQPRKHFNAEALQELAASLKQHGLAQPIVVRPKPGAVGQYEIIAGERRWRAAQLVPLHDVPVVIHDIDDKTAMEIAIVENLQRVDLNPLEEARAFQRLIDEYGYKHEQLATSLGKSRSHISNMLRLLQLPEAVQDKLQDGSLSMGHARALITAENPEAVVEMILKNNLSVRDTEKLASKKNAANAGNPGPKQAQAVSAKNKDADIKALENNLSQLLGLAVTIDVASATRGTLKIEYQNLDQLDDVLRRLSV